MRPPRWPSGQGIRLESGRRGFDSRFCRGSFSRLSPTSDLNVGTPVATLRAPGSIELALFLFYFYFYFLVCLVVWLVFVCVCVFVFF